MAENNQENSNNLELTIKIFVDPQAAFTKIKSMPHWVYPVLITFLVTYAFTIFTQDVQLEMQKSFIMDSGSISENQKDDMLESIENPTFFMKNIMPIIGVVFSAFLFPLIIGAVLLILGNFVYGGSASFLLTFSIAAWAGLIGVLEVLIKLPLVISNGSLKVYTSLALLMDFSQSETFLFQFLNIFDVFTVWKVIVYSTAFMVIYNFSKAKSYATIITLTMVASLVGIGFSQLFV